MKKFFLLILAFAYLGTSSGATIYIHQCMGKTIEWDLQGDEGHKCEKCGMHKNAANDCCHDHVKMVKMQNDQNIPATFFSKVFLSPALPTPVYSVYSSRLFSSETKSIESRILTKSGEIDYCILFCTFLI
jgi:hypothetical protein